MIDGAATEADPFASTALDEETEMRALVQALRFSEGFKLFLVRCNQPQHRQRLIAEARGRLPEHQVQEVFFAEPVTNLNDALRERLGSSDPEVVFVTGIEYSLPVAADAHATPFVANLNASRDSFRQSARPLVLWVPEYVLNALMLGAPDFFSVRSGVYYFAAAPSETMEIANALTAGTVTAADSLSLAEKQDRIEAIRELLADYEALHTEHRDWDTEKRLHFRLGTLLSGLGMYDLTQYHYQCLLDIAHKTHDQFWEGTALNALGILLGERGDWEKAAAMSERALQIAEKLNNQNGIAASLGNLANAYCQRERWEEAQRIYEQCIEIRRTQGNRTSEGIQLGNLALVLVEQGEYTAAEEAFRRRIKIAHGIHDQAGESRALINLGSMYAKQGRLREAENSFQRSLEIARRIGMRGNQWTALFNLAILRNTQGDLHGATELQRKTVEVLSQMDDERTLTQQRAILAEWEQQLMDEQQPVSGAAVSQLPKRRN